MTFKLIFLIEEKRQGPVDPHRSEVATRLVEAQSEDTGEETRRSHLVVSRDDRVIEDNRHGNYPARATALAHRCSVTSADTLKVQSAQVGRR
jgi:hypothetical protein